MAADMEAIKARAAAFYDFAGKTVLHVGAGGGQLVDAARGAARITAIDVDEAAVRRLADAARAKGLDDRLEARVADFMSWDETADVVLLEFCLHEMPDPAAALRKARSLAPDVVVIDHDAGSPWAAFTGEAEKVASGGAALDAARPRRSETAVVPQAFASREELEKKIAVLGAAALARAAALPPGPISFAMPFRLALI